MNTQQLHLMVYALPRQRRWLIAEHSPLTHESGELYLRADLSCYAVPSQCPQEPGLHLVEARASILAGRWGGVRLEILGARQLSGGLERIGGNVRRFN